ncbi:MAG: GTP-binding protein, partial [Sediminibacterium sp.]|nr:GTP-binding protein [Sediminibacterium sp.]
MNILKFMTCGSVDDGKSTLIGRLLYDSDAIATDQIQAVEKKSKEKNNDEIDLSLLTDGLKAEREQGITIDVAYRYFNSDKKKYIIVDCPGHIQYTRNMITGASNIDVAIILIDARKGVIEQTKRHSMIVALFKIPTIIVAINKMDLVNFDEKIYNNIVADYTNLASKINVNNIKFIPICAILGDNIVKKSANINWYKGDSLLSILENRVIEIEHTKWYNRFQVQYVIRPQTQLLHDYRAYIGKVNSGSFHVGQLIKVMPSGLQTKISKIEFAGENKDMAYSPQSVSILLADEIDISRGDYLIAAEDTILKNNQLNATICWFDEENVQLNHFY